jgi:membrane protein
VQAGLAGLVRDVARSTRGHDLALYAAGVTFYAAIGVVPLLLLALYLSGLLVGADTVRHLSDVLAARLPSNLGARAAAQSLAATGSDLRMGAAVAALVPATLYGEGLVRAFDRLSVRGDRGRRSLRGRLGSLVLVAVSPVLLLVGLATTSGFTRALGDGTGPRLLGIYLAFLVGWLTVSVLLLFAYRGLAPERPGRRALLWGALGTASVVSGTSLGWVLFLGIRIPLAQAYGGSTPIAAAAVSFLWLYLLHAIVLLGYVTTLRLDARRGHPRGPVLERDTVRRMPTPYAA